MSLISYGPLLTSSACGASILVPAACADSRAPWWPRSRSGSICKVVPPCAAAVHVGLVEVDDDTRAVLEKARQIHDQDIRHPHLAVVPDPESDVS